ncbi:hypothetical protein [Pseudomonas sp. MF7453]|uniref:hypothetical protein n=1 Tax=Pseudomonas sp. MF7453 TaxID=2797539 RepID=UPI0018E75A71|nr:hypothetical protein [Pseudomonas sp. MF7453]MBJ2221310.1 hypothetical protein [Pseudomonas sp. MF7453]
MYRIGAATPGKEGLLHTLCTLGQVDRKKYSEGVSGVRKLGRHHRGDHASLRREGRETTAQAQHDHRGNQQGKPSKHFSMFHGAS